MGRNGGSGIRLVDALPDDGERRLMLAALMDAIRILRQPPGHRTSGCRAWAEERKWLDSPEHLRPFAFVAICNSLGIEPDYVRRCVTHGRCAPLPMNGRRYAARTEESWSRMRRPRQQRATRAATGNATATIALARDDEVIEAEEVDPFPMAAAVNL